MCDLASVEVLGRVVRLDGVSHDIRNFTGGADDNVYEVGSFDMALVYEFSLYFELVSAGCEIRMNFFYHKLRGGATDQDFISFVVAVEPNITVSVFGVFLHF